MREEKHITPEQADEMINQILEHNSAEVGIFISLLAKKYIETHEVTKEQFMQSLSNSLDKLGEDVK